jgi:hypothetical protein
LEAIMANPATGAPAEGDADGERGDDGDRGDRRRRRGRRGAIRLSKTC